VTTVHEYTPRGVCVDLFESREPELLIAGPAGTGKSRACLEKLHTMAMANPGMRGLMVRKTQVSLTSTALVTWKRDVIPEAVAAGAVEYYGGSRESPAQYRYSNGATVEVGGMDRSTKIMSSEYDVVYVQEATELSEDDWEAITTRLRSNVVSFQQLIGDCNPERPTHWLKQRADRGQVYMLESAHTDNPTLYTDAGELTDDGASYMSKLDALTGTRFQRLRLGNWVGAEGVIFPEFETSRHVIDAYPIPDEWNRYWSVDFGFVNPFSCQMWAEAPDGELILYREYYGTHRLVSEWAETILNDITDDLGQWLEPRPVTIICDHDAEGRETFSSVIGQGTQPAIKRVLDGIQAVQARLRDGRLLFMRDVLVSADPILRDASKPASVVEEIGGYIWADTKAKEQPLKVDDHGCDAMRYMVAQRDVGSRPGVRFL
jgi:phage terminase large subunit